MRNTALKSFLILTALGFFSANASSEYCDWALNGFSISSATTSYTSDFVCQINGAIVATKTLVAQPTAASVCSVTVNDNNYINVGSCNTPIIVPCGESQPAECIPMPNSSLGKPEKIIAELKETQTILDARVDRPKIDGGFSNSQSSCEYVIKYELEGKIVYLVVWLCD